MAEEDDPFKKRERETASDDSDLEEPVKLDLINLNTNKNFNISSKHNFHGSGITTNHTNMSSMKRDDNPFSFKHFLRSDKNNYQSQGARPKVFCDRRTTNTVSDLDLHSSPELNQARIIPEFSSALPDFVQDHLVIEQCFLNNSSSNYNLPDFTQGRINNEIRESSHNAETSENSIMNTVKIPLDLPVVRPQVEFPLDLPISEPVGNRNCSLTSEVGNSKSLPDFLSDGAVNSQNNEILNSIHTPERETDRLRLELDLLRRQYNEQLQRSDYLCHELEISKNKEHQYTQNLAKALEQLEENLKRSNTKAASSENTILSLRHEIKSLTVELNALRRENQQLKGEEGATGGPHFHITTEFLSHRLPQELRSAANTAEHSLRQLLTGVDNLRILASSVESMSRFEEQVDSYNSDVEDKSGPAL